MGNGSGACRDAYIDGAIKRSTYPLKNGHYKLVDLRMAIEADYRFWAQIRDAKLLPKRRRDDVHLPDDAGQWLKALPVNVCRRLGHDLNASIQALDGDGVQPADIQRIAFGAEQLTNRVIDWFEEAHQLLRVCGIEVEYSKMRRGQSLLAAPLSEAIDLVKWVSSQAEIYGQAA